MSAIELFESFHNFLHKWIPFVKTKNATYSYIFSTYWNLNKLIYLFVGNHIIRS